MSDSLLPHGLQHAKPPCPSPTPGDGSNSCPSSPSNHLILCRPLLLPSSIFLSIEVFSNESLLHIRWPKDWSFSFSISPSSEYSRLILFRIDWLDLLVVQGTLKNFLQHHNLKAPIDISHFWNISTYFSFLKSGDPKGNQPWNIHWKDCCWSWSSNTLATWWEEPTHWKRPWCWKRLRAGEGDNRRWAGWMASPTWWTWVWADSGSWWWTGRPGMMQFMGSWRVGHNWETELNWTYFVLLLTRHGTVKYEKLLDIFPSNYLFIIPFLFVFLLTN